MIVVEKVAGALAEQGADLAAVAAAGRDVVRRSRTLALALDGCTHPGDSTPAFELGPDEIEFGVGIHGERGTRRIAFATADELTDQLVEPLVDDLGLQRGQSVIAIVNGLGGAYPLELSIVARRLHPRRARHRHRALARRLLRHEPRHARRVHHAHRRRRRPRRRLGRPCPHPDAHLVREETMTTAIDGTVAANWIAEFHRTFDTAQQRLTELDRLAGDGDFGTNIASALRRVDEAMPTASDATYRSVFEAVSSGFLATGGTSGPLFGMWFRTVSRAGDATASLQDLADGVAKGLDRIKALGGAKVGDNTMIDALEPASDALRDAASDDASLTEALERAARAARDGARSTGELVASRGRASYVGELARGVLDPGAVTIALFFEAGATAVGSAEQWEALAADTSVR